MSIVCPGCKHEIAHPSDTKSADVICPKCSKEFLPAGESVQRALSPGDQLGGYEIVGLLGSGGMGKVYEAVQLSLQRRVALKVIEAQVAGSDTKVKRFLLEVRSTASLEHHSIVTVFEASRDEHLLYLAMELVEGVSLDTLLKKTDGPLDERTAWSYALQVCDAMNYAWKYQQLLHRDIKPANIMVLNDDRIKICDLGIAKRRDDEFDLSREGMAIGTPHYMSPEQGQGAANLDFRADVYSLGATVFHLITGRVPYPGINPIMVITSHIVDEQPDPRAVNNQLSDGSARLTMLMMAKKPKDRHPSWEALKDDIERVIQGDMPEFEAPSDHSGKRSAIKPEPIIPAKDARKGKRTMVDMDAVRSELKRSELWAKRAKGGWQLVRVGYLTALLAVLVAGVAFAYRKEFMPDIFAPPPPLPSPQLLLLDDGTDPAPPDEPNGTVLLSDREKMGSLFESILEHAETNGYQSPEHLNELVSKVTSSNYSITSFSRYCASVKHFDLAIAVNHYILVTPETCRPAEMGAACLDLIDYLHFLGRIDSIPAVFQTAIQNADTLPHPYAAAVYIGFADHHWMNGRPTDGLKLLSNGFERFVRRKQYAAADMVATTLIRHAQTNDDSAELQALCNVISGSLPENQDAARLAQSILDEIATVP